MCVSGVRSRVRRALQGKGTVPDVASNGDASLDRREFLRRAGLLGGGLAGMSVLAACGGGAAPAGAPAATTGAAAGGATSAPAAAGATSAPAAAEPSAKISKPPDGTGGGKQLIFRGWNYHPEVVIDNTS